MTDKTKPTDRPWRKKFLAGSWSILGPEEDRGGYTSAIRVASGIVNEHDAQLIVDAVNGSGKSIQDRMNEYTGCIVAIHPIPGGLGVSTSIGKTPNDLAIAAVDYEFDSWDMQIEKIVDAFRSVITARLTSRGGSMGLQYSVNDILGG